MQRAELEAAGIMGVPEEVYLPVDCKECDQSGYRGRTGIFELLVLDDIIKDAITSGTRDDQVRALARTLGMSFTEQDASAKVAAGGAPH